MTCDADNTILSQRWVLSEENGFVKIRNSRFGKCLTVLSGAVDDDPVFVRDCVDGDLEQLFSFNGNLYLVVTHYNGLCLSNSGDFLLSKTCFTSSSFNFIVKMSYGIYNPFFKKSLEIGNSEVRIMNRKIKVEQVYILILKDFLMNRFFIINNDLGTGFRSDGSGFLKSDSVDLSIVGTFSLEYVKDNLFGIKSSNTGKCLGISLFEREEASKVYMIDCAVEKNQMWIFVAF